ncbi:MAG: tRNA pseudouridine(38-40) synthase TruA [Pseudomonadales bacterium]|nr:tRNA pseudouridine(38-40) synthase TruA [Pseudomonadales bacterium]
MTDVQQRICLGVTYNGADFHGWQYQSENVATVQQCLEKALSKVADHHVRVTCAGRTDSGVHATWQVVHFDTQSSRPLKAWVFGVNAHLPDSVCVTWARSVPADFDARFSATARRYFYLIHNHPVRSALMAELVSRDHRPLDADVMNEAAAALPGERDFTSFRAANCQSNTPMRNVHHARVQRRGDLIVIDIAANAFLHHMVRNIAGVLQDIGAGEKPVSWMAELLELRDRTRAGVTAPPNGLYLVDVTYPEDFGLPAGPGLPHLYGLLDA